jgi:hypothetical protein
MPDYALGTTPPTLRPDEGSGAWCSDPRTAAAGFYKRAIELAMDSGVTDVAIGTTATRHMRHYINNSGDESRVDVPALITRSTKLAQHYGAEVQAAKAFVESLGEGRHAIRSSSAAGGRFFETEDRDLFFAIGGYSYWGMGDVVVAATGDRASTLEARLDFRFHFYDRYNWDRGKKVDLRQGRLGITVDDTFMQRFHKQCQAREYDLRGEVRGSIQWRFVPGPSDPFRVLR